MEKKMFDKKTACALVALSLLSSSNAFPMTGYPAGRGVSTTPDRTMLYHPATRTEFCGTISPGETDGFILRLASRSYLGITVQGRGGLRPCFLLKDTGGTLLGEDFGSWPEDNPRVLMWMGPGDYLLDISGRGTAGSYCLHINTSTPRGEAPFLSYGTQELLKKVLVGGIIAGSYLGFAAYMRESRYDAEPRDNPFGTLNAITGPAAAGFAAFTTAAILALHDSLGDGLNRYYAAYGAVALAFGAGIVGAVACGIGGFRFREEISGNRALYYGTSALTIAVPIFIYSID